MYAAIVVVRLPDFEVVEVAGAAMSARFPYIPGLFSFREVPPLLRAFARLRTRPDAILFDGHGRAHPRRFGLACHAGVLLDCPSVGCAKSILVGEHVPVGLSRGARAPLVAGGETIGAALRTRPGVRPVYVSVGHRVDLDSAVRLVLATTRGFRLPQSNPPRPPGDRRVDAAARSRAPCRRTARLPRLPQRLTNPAPSPGPAARRNPARFKLWARLPIEPVWKFLPYRRARVRRGPGQGPRSARRRPWRP